MRRSRLHVARLRDSVKGPADAWLLTRIVGWSLVLPLAKSLVSMPRLTRLMQTSARATSRDPEREKTVASLTAWVFKTRPRDSRDNCLERALVTYRYLCRAGARPELVIGMARDAEGVRGHAWVTVDGRGVHDTPMALAVFQPILRFRSDGTMQRLPPG
jgi:transglutaminase superfamily protein